MKEGHEPPITHIGINAVFLEPRMGGLETYVRRLVPALIEARQDLRISIFVNELGRELLGAEPWARDVELVTHPLLGRRYFRAATELTLLGWLASRSSVDVLHSVALTAPVRTRPANVITIADVTWLRQPGAVPPATRLLWKTIVPPVARRADRIITLSEAARREIVEDLRVSPDRVEVIHCGSGSEPVSDPTTESELRSKLRLGSGPIVLAVSSLRSHKNLPRLIEAMSTIRHARADAVLVVPGHLTEQQPELEQHARVHGVADAVFFPGWVDSRDLEGLYRAASCFVFPSLREGFGLPVLEAMRRELPVACANASAVPEVAGNAALYFDPTKPGEIAAAALRLLDEPELAEDLRARGLERQRLFTWRHAAEETLACYERARAA